MSDQLSKITNELKKLRKNGKSKHYPEHLKQNILKLIEGGASLNKLSMDLKIHPTTLTSWKNKNRINKKEEFKPVKVIDDNQEVKVTIISGLKLSDLRELF